MTKPEAWHASSPSPGRPGGESVCIAIPQAAAEEHEARCSHLRPHNTHTLFLCVLILALPLLLWNSVGLSVHNPRGPFPSALATPSLTLVPPPQAPLPIGVYQHLGEVNLSGKSFTRSVRGVEQDGANSSLETPGQDGVDQSAGADSGNSSDSGDNLNEPSLSDDASNDVNVSEDEVGTGTGDSSSGSGGDGKPSASADSSDSAFSSTDSENSGSMNSEDSASKDAKGIEDSGTSSSDDTGTSASEDTASKGNPSEDSGSHDADGSGATPSKDSGSNDADSSGATASEGSGSKDADGSGTEDSASDAAEDSEIDPSHGTGSTEDLEPKESDGTQDTPSRIAAIHSFSVTPSVLPSLAPGVSPSVTASPTPSFSKGFVGEGPAPPVSTALATPARPPAIPSPSLPLTPSPSEPPSPSPLPPRGEGPAPPLANSPFPSRRPLPSNYPYSPFPSIRQIDVGPVDSNIKKNNGKHDSNAGGLSAISIAGVVGGGLMGLLFVLIILYFLATKLNIGVFSVKAKIFNDQTEESSNPTQSQVSYGSDGGPNEVKGAAALGGAAVVGEGSMFVNQPNLFSSPNEPIVVEDLEVMADMSAPMADLLEDFEGNDVVFEPDD